MSDWLNDLAWNAIAYGLVAGAAVGTLTGLWLFLPALRRSWLPLPRLRPVTWTGHEVLLTVCVAFGFPLIVIETLLRVGFFTNLLGPSPEIDVATPAWKLYRERCGVIVGPLLLALTLGSLFAIFFARTGTRPHHLGLSWARWPANIALGIVGFLAAMPIVLGIFAVLTLVLEQSDHQVTQIAKGDAPAWLWILIAFQVSVAAPLLEEIILRGIVQRWLRHASLAGHLTTLTFAIFLSLSDLMPANLEGTFNVQKIPAASFGVLLAIGYGFWMYRLARRFGLKEAEIQTWKSEPSAPSLDPSIADEAAARRLQARTDDEAKARAWADANARLAIYGSAMLFAIIHSAWPAPIPLFLLGLVLGWLAHRTQSLIGPITLHALFNLVSFIALYGSVVSAPDRNGNAQTTAGRPSTTISVPASHDPLRR
ncbi:MAG: CPBP family intramembrane metalloprotease [Rhizobiales bacterium]|nr:CPBP family intramembrane metalloprotease [Hyphomicrobiales bacterium]